MSLPDKEHLTGYVTERADVYDGHNGPEINLGLATSPFGPASELAEPLNRRSPLAELAEYPSDPLHAKTRELLVEGLGLKVSPEAVHIVDNGSYGAGDEVIRFFARQGKTDILVPTYSFPNVAQWALRHGAEYKPLPTVRENPLESLKHVLNMGDELEGRVVYMDYPNNPFGIADPQLMRDVVDHVSAHKGIPFVDLAFGEVLGEEFKGAIQHTVDRGGIAIGSLSKTQGLPGLRSGYIVTSEALMKKGYNGAQKLVFGINREAEFTYNQLFSKDSEGKTLARRHSERVAEYNTETNQQLYKGLEALGLGIGITDLRTPIQVVISKDQGFYGKLARQGLVTESLSDYGVTLADNGVGYGDRAVRMLTPRPGQVHEVIRRVGKALNSI